MIVTDQAQLDRLLEQYLAEMNQNFGYRALAKITLDAVQEVDATALETVSVPANREWRMNPKTLLTLLTYCYGVGLYNPADIEDAIEDDQTVKYLAARSFPSSSELRRFRREHRAMIQRGLVRFFERLWVATYLGLDPNSMDPAEWENAIREADLPPSLLVQFGRLAEEHILLALLWDGPALRD